ncbi:MAG: hypothetical protein AAB368_08310, partial [bacterium]
IARARAKFPTGEHLLLALAEECGELVRELLSDPDGDSDDFSIPAHPDHTERVEREIIQALAMVVRLSEEGDSDHFQRKPPAQPTAPPEPSGT